MRRGGDRVSAETRKRDTGVSAAHGRGALTPRPVADRDRLTAAAEKIGVSGANESIGSHAGL